MSDFFQRSLLIQANKQVNRLQSLSTQSVSNIIGEPTGFDNSTGLYLATTADGSEVQYKQGSFRQTPDTILLSNTQSSTISFGDWQ